MRFLKRISLRLAVKDVYNHYVFFFLKKTNNTSSRLNNNVIDVFKTLHYCDYVYLHWLTKYDKFHKIIQSFANDYYNETIIYWCICWIHKIYDIVLKTMSLKTWIPITFDVLCLLWKYNKLFAVFSKIGFEITENVVFEWKTHKKLMIELLIGLVKQND